METPNTQPVAVAPVATEIVIDIDLLTIGDFGTLQNIGKEGADVNEMLDLLERCVVGGARHRPLRQLIPAVQQLTAAVGQAMNPESGQSGN